MKSISSAEEYTNFVKNNRASILYFSTDECNVCKVLKPKLEHFLTEKFPKIEARYINTLHMNKIAAENNVFTVPTIILFFEGKDYLRKSRNINFDEFEEDLKRLYSLFFDD